MPGFDELRKRGVIRAAAIYAVGAYGAIEIVDWLLENLAPQSPDWVMPAIAILFLAGFPAALYLAWTTDIEKKPVVVWGAAGLILVGTALALLYAVNPIEENTPRVSVLMPNPQQSDELATWASNDLRELLREIDEIEVLGRTTVMMSTMMPASGQGEIEDFGVTHRIHTDLMRSSGRIEYSVALHTKDGQEIWSESYQGEPLNLFDFQKEAVEDIAGELGVPNDAAGLRVIRLRQDPTSKLEAFEALARGQAQFFMAGDILCEQAMAEFDRAIALDPQMGMAYAHKGLCYGLQAWVPELPRDDPAWEQAVVNLRRGATLDPSITVEAYEWIAHFEAARNRWETAREALEAARKIKPDAFSFVLANSTGECGQVIDRMTREYELDPLSPLNASMVAIGYLTCHGRVDRDEGLRWMRVAMGTMAGGNYDRAIAPFLEVGDRETAVTIWNTNWNHVSRRLWEGGEDPEEFMDLFFDALLGESKVVEFGARVKDLESRGLFGPEQNAFLLVMVGAVAEAYDSIYQALDANRFNIHVFMSYGEGPRRVKSDPRYMDVLERVGLIDYWDTYGWPPVCEQSEAGDWQCY